MPSLSCDGLSADAVVWIVMLGRELDDIVAAVVNEWHSSSPTETTATERCRL